MHSTNAPVETNLLTTALKRALDREQDPDLREWLQRLLEGDGTQAAAGQSKGGRTA